MDRAKGFENICFRPAREIILQCSSHGWKQKQLVGEPTAEWVSYECSLNKHGLWIVYCQSTSSHDPSLCQITQMRRTCGVVLWSIESFTGLDMEAIWMWLKTFLYTVAEWSKKHKTSVLHPWFDSFGVFCCMISPYSSPHVSKCWKENLTHTSTFKHILTPPHHFFMRFHEKQDHLLNNNWNYWIFKCSKSQ